MNPAPPTDLIHESLTRLWQRAHNGLTDNQHWDQDLGSLFALGIGMEEALHYLYTGRPDIENFLQWCYCKTKTSGAIDAVCDDVLTDAELAHWEKNGYILLRDAVSAEDAKAGAAAIWEYLDADAGEPESWYRAHAGINGMMLRLTQHEALDALRRSPRIRRAYEQLYGTDRIYTVVDKAGFNPPERQGYSFRGSMLHWDTSLVLPVPLRLQGLLYLSDTTASDGAFHCVPGFHRRLESWLASLPDGANARVRAPLDLEPVPVAAKAGDLIIWHSALPHCATPNRGRLPRLVLYLTYLPEGFNDSREWL